MHDISHLLGNGIIENFDPELKRAFNVKNEAEGIVKDARKLQIRKGVFIVSGDATFFTLQGEGVNMGEPAVFFRLQICNLRCVWCDAWYTWNPKNKDTEEYLQVKRSIEINGLQESIKVRENNGFEIIDGEQRWTACKELGFANVLIYNEGIISDQKARELTLWWQTQVPVDEIMVADLIAGLIKEYENIEVPFSQEQIDEYIKLSEFDNTQKPDKPDPKFTITFTQEEFETVKKAIAKVQGEKPLGDGKALELICLNYLAEVEHI